MRRIAVVAHRGSSADHADNSWAAFEAAVAEGADAIECDVQASRDGTLLVRHDLLLDGIPIADLTDADIARRHAGMPRLGDLLAWATRADIDLLVEVKDPAVATATARMIDASGWAARCVLGGFHGPALAAAKDAVPRVRTSFMIGSVAGPPELILLARAYRTDGVHLCWESRAPRPHTLLDPAAMRALRDADLALTLWHEEREDELCALVALAPDAICTNTPVALRRIVDAGTAPRDGSRPVPNIGRATPEPAT